MQDRLSVHVVEFKSMKYLLVIVSFIIFSTSVSSQADSIPFQSVDKSKSISPSHVYQKTLKVISELESIRTAANISTSTREPGVQMNKRPVHVYSKALEVLEKISRYQHSLGIDAVETGHIPLRKVTPTEVYEQTQLILSELSKIKVAQGLQTDTKTFPFIPGKGPSEVYESMWKASYLLDALAGQTSPNEVFRNSQYILVDLDLIADKLNVDFDAHKSTQRFDSKSPKDVNLEAFKILHKVGRLERHLDIMPLSPPPFPAGDILPTDALDSTNTILAELVRVKVELGITKPKQKLPVPSGKSPNDVFSQMLIISARLKTLLKTSGSREPSGLADASYR